VDANIHTYVGNTTNNAPYGGGEIEEEAAEVMHMLKKRSCSKNSKNCKQCESSANQ